MGDQVYVWGMLFSFLKVNVVWTFVIIIVAT